MHIIISHAENIGFNSLEDLASIIPQGCYGNAVNYGQDEGQIQIEDTIWGIYYNGDNTYHLQYEEGLISWPVLNKLADSIMKQICSVFGDHLNFSVRGALMHHEPHELYLSK